MLGDLIHEALSRVGVTPEKVSAWLGKPCGCEERRRKLNQLGAWARRVVLFGKADRAKEYLDRITGAGE